MKDIEAGRPEKGISDIEHRTPEPYAVSPFRICRGPRKDGMIKVERMVLYEVFSELQMIPDIVIIHPARIVNKYRGEKEKEGSSQDPFQLNCPV